MTVSPPALLAPQSRPRVMGILNVTPDSFSDGGRWSEEDAAVAQGEHLLAEGADLVDVGGESTRPGATRTSLADELERTVPVVRRLAAIGGAVSVDTMRAEVAARALEAGACLVNDVSGGLADPAMLPTVAAARAPYVAMHWRGHSDRMQELAVYAGPGGVVAAVRAELAERLDEAAGAGVDPGLVVLDPGLGFAKTPEQSWELVVGIGELATLGPPLLVGASRKGFLGALLAGPDGVPRPVDEREHAHAALAAWLAQQGVWGLRVHDVRACRDALAVAARVASGRGRGFGGDVIVARSERAPDDRSLVASPEASPDERPAMRSDVLEITGIECFGHHGVFASERRDGQRFVVDVALGTDTAPSAGSDDLRDTVDYGSLVSAVKTAVESDPVDLIETLAHRVAQVCLLPDRVEWARVTVHKPEAPIDATFADVALTITRKREVHS